ncbi:MAG: ABC transporter permease [Lachnospiraceae bacterium]|nr:ABC transporter permease [Lachnospiraceae bacterium]
MGEKQEWQRIGAWQEFQVLTEQYFRILMSDKRNLMVSLLFPVLAAAIEVGIAGKDMFYTFENTKSGCFVLVSAAIWGGLFNSIQTVVRERDNIKRAYVTGLRFYCYIFSRALLQLALCVIQSFVLTLSFLGVSAVWDHNLPSQGIIFSGVLPEFFVTILLLMYAADMMGLMISCIVRKTETANVLAPYILIVQLIFSGILFKLEDTSKMISYLMISRWGMEGLGSSCNVNHYPLRIERSSKMKPVYEVFPNLDLSSSDSMFDHNSEHLLKVWLILLVFSIVFLVVGDLLLHRVSRDTR